MSLGPVRLWHVGGVCVACGILVRFTFPHVVPAHGRIDMRQLALVECTLYAVGMLLTAPALVRPKETDKGWRNAGCLL
jgi:hypothetical protein